MRQRSKTRNARLQGASCARPDALTGSSSIAMARAWRRSALVGGIGCTLLLLPDNQLNASDLVDNFTATYEAAGQLLAPEAGAPFMTVKLMPAVTEGAAARLTSQTSGSAQQYPELVVLHHHDAPELLELQMFDPSVTRLDPVEAYARAGNLALPDLAPEDLHAYSSTAIGRLSDGFGGFIAYTSEVARRSAGALIASADSLSLASVSSDGASAVLPFKAPDDVPAPKLPETQDAILADRRIAGVAYGGSRGQARPEIIWVTPPAVSRHEPGANPAQAGYASLGTTIGQASANLRLPEPASQDAWIILAASRGKEEDGIAGTGPAASSAAFSKARDDDGIAAGSFADGVAAPARREFSGNGTIDAWDGSATPLPGVSGDRLVDNAPEPLHAVIEDDQGVPLVKLAALVDLLSDDFDPEELRRLQRSRAMQKYVSLDRISESGIPLVYEATSERLALETDLAHSSTGSSGEAQGGSGASLSGLTSGSALSFDASASVGFDSNPFLSDRQSPEAASFRLQLAPTIERSTARTSIRATGRIQHVEYLGKYRSLQNLGADIAATHRLTERLDINAGLLFRSDILATDLANPLINGDTSAPTIPVIPGGNDVTLLGERQRREQYGADAGLTYTPSERNEIRWSAAFRADRFATNELSESNFYSQQLRYSHQLNGAIGIGAVVNASIIDFTSAAFGDTQTVTPQALVTARLSERLNATGSFGVAISRVELPTGKETNTAFAGNLSLCYEAPLSRLCVNGSRQVLPSAIGGARIQATGGLTYSLRLSERDTLQFGGNYSTASQPLASTGDDFESINAFGRYERRINERMRLQASLGYLNTSGDNRIEASNFQALVGLSIKLGRNK